MKKFLFPFLMAVLGGATTLTFANLLKKDNNADRLVSQRIPAKFASNPDESLINPDFTQAAAYAVHCVVHVKTESTARTNTNDPFFDFFFGNPFNNLPPQKAMASGSGVIISENGYIVTNNHVVQNADKVQVVLNDKREFSAEVIGKDPTTDLALLKIEAKELSFLNYGNSDNVKVGEWALAVGNPFSLTSTVTAGIISAKGRNINILNEKFAIESFIQTDAAVNPGNSGGALVNTKGELIGINSAIASNTGSYAGYSFAIPVNIVRKVIADLIEYGEVQRAFLGVVLQDLNADLASKKGIKEIKGVYISELSEDGAAENAGLKEGDIILKIEDAEVNNIPELQEQIGLHRPGDKILITIKRKEETKNVMVELKNKDGDTNVVKASENILSDLGAELQSVSPGEKSKLGISGGVRVVKLKNGKLSSVGIKPGFIITHIGNKEVNSPEDIAKIVQSEKRGLLIEGVYPNGSKAYYGIGL